MKRQKWIPVAGYEELYEISDFGHIYSYEKDMFRKPNMGTKYLQIGLTKDGKQNTFPLHVLVAVHFVENPDPVNKTVVHHIDGNKFNNHADNLIWLTPEEHNLLHKEGHRQIMSKPVVQKTLDGVEIARFSSTRDAKEKIGANPGHISDCCNHKRKTHLGCLWEYI